MKNQELYKRLAAEGNAHAKHLMDTVGAVPVARASDQDSEEEELEDLKDLATQVAVLVAKAEAHALTRNYAMAADAHMQRGQMLEEAGSHKEAMDAYKAGALSLFQHAKDCGYAEGYSLPQIQAIHARMNAEGK